MNTKRWIIASLVVFAVSQVYEFLVHGVLLRSAYEATKNLWRPDMDSMMWIMYAVGFITSFPFVYIFAKGYESKGIMEGLRFGFVVGVMTAIPMAYGTYAMIAVPYHLALSWFIAGLIECMLLGVVAALVYKPKTA